MYSWVRNMKLPSKVVDRPIVNMSQQRINEPGTYQVKVDLVEPADAGKNYIIAHYVDRQRRRIQDRVWIYGYSSKELSQPLITLCKVLGVNPEYVAGFNKYKLLEGMCLQILVQRGDGACAEVNAKGQFTVTDVLTRKQITPLLFASYKDAYTWMDENKIKRSYLKITRYSQWEEAVEYNNEHWKNAHITANQASSVQETNSASEEDSGADQEYSDDDDECRICS